jgi:hypothetical protein
VTFDHRPINAIIADTVAELSRVVDAIERDGDSTAMPAPTPTRGG